MYIYTPKGDAPSLSSIYYMKLRSKMSFLYVGLFLSHDTIFNKKGYSSLGNFAFVGTVTFVTHSVSTEP